MKYFIVGGAGFIGSHASKRLLKTASTEAVTVYDNFSSGKMEFLAEAVGDPRLRIVTADASDVERLTKEMAGHDTVFHFASNPDIAKAMKEPDIDFWQGTYLTQNVIEAMRRTSARMIIYASGSGVYGDTGENPVFESMGPLLPISTYGASKLAGEALICSYSYLFDIRALAFRFANVVGPNQTHGVGFDFLRRLHDDPKRLRILGDGSQSKAYIHVEDILSGIETAIARSKEKYTVFNLATDDYLTVNEIATMAMQLMNAAKAEIEYTGGDRGWKGDVPIVRFNTSLIKSLGWTPRRDSKQAMFDAMSSMKNKMWG